MSGRAQTLDDAYAEPANFLEIDVSEATNHCELPPTPLPRT